MKFLSLVFLFSCCATFKPSHPQAVAQVEPPAEECEQPTAAPPAAPVIAPGAPVMVTVETFDEAAVGGVVDKLQALAKEGHSEIWVKLNTNGGSVGGMHTLSMAMETLGQPVTCVADWHAYSAGAYLLESPGCTTRYMTKRSTILFHEALTEAQGNIHQLARDAAMLKALTDSIVDQTSERMGMTEDAFQAQIENKEWTLDYKEALKWHAIDGIVSPLKLPPLVAVEAKKSLLQILLGG